MLNSTKKVITGMLLGTILLLGSGSFLGSTAEAQGWHRGGFAPRQRVFVPRQRVFIPQQRVFVSPRVRVFPRVYGYSSFGPYPYYASPYYSYGYAPYSRYDLGPTADQQGYRDGFDRGQEDARNGNGYNPNNSSHFRNAIGSTYREEFRKGYDYGYHQYAG